MAVDLLDVAGEGILSNPKIGSDLLATATLEKEFENQAFPWRKLGNRDGTILGPSHLMEPGNLAQNNVGDASVTRGEGIGGIPAIDPNATDCLLIDRTIGDNHAADIGLLPQPCTGIIRVSPVSILMEGNLIEGSGEVFFLGVQLVDDL